MKGTQDFCVLFWKLLRHTENKKKFTDLRLTAPTEPLSSQPGRSRPAAADPAETDRNGPVFLLLLSGAEAADVSLTASELEVRPHFKGTTSKPAGVRCCHSAFKLGSAGLHRKTCL